MILRRFLALLSCTALFSAAPTRAADPVKMLGWLTGTWHCTFSMGSQKQLYTARFATAMGGSWLRETDTSAAGSGEFLLTYVRGTHRWRGVITLSDASATVFDAPDTGLAHIAWHSVYPDTSMHDTFDRISFTEYRLHFEQRTGGKILRSSDVCTKV